MLIGDTRRWSVEKRVVKGKIWDEEEAMEGFVMKSI